MSVVIRKQNITCEYKKWFRENRVYLTLNLCNNGHWRLYINKDYQRDEIKKSDWKRIKKQCEEKIKVTQRYVLKGYKTQRHYRNSYYDDNGSLEVSHTKCYEIINKEYDLLFEGKI